MNRQESVNRGRRVFLKSLLTGSAIVVAQSMGGGLLTQVFAQTGQGGVKRYDLPQFQARFIEGVGFEQSVASGDPTSSGAVLWTRVDPAIAGGVRERSYDAQWVQWLDHSSSPPTETIRNAIMDGQFVQLEVSTQPSFSQVEFQCFTPIWGDFDQVVKVDVDGHLDPNQTYYYRFITKSGHVSQTGRFKTLPPEGASLSSTKFAYVSCQDYTSGYYYPYRMLAEEELDFVVHLGDYIYESVSDPSYQNPLPDRQIQLPSGEVKAYSLEDYRTVYRTMRADNDLQRLHEQHAMIAIWDDHEFANNSYFPAVAPDDESSSNPTRRRCANQAWFEYMPARVTFEMERNFSDFRIYRSFKVGDLLELILTDQRLFRSALPCGNDVLDIHFTRGCEQIFAEDQSMLGHPHSGQRDWFLQQMITSKRVWKVWANEVQFTPLKLLGRYLNLDAWDGYSSEREYITSEIKRAGVKNWITITGDLHTYEAGLIKEDYKHDHDRDAVGVEFMVGSITSYHLADIVTLILPNWKRLFELLRGKKGSKKYSPASSPLPLTVVEEILVQPEMRKEIEDEIEDQRKRAMKEGREQIFGEEFLEKIIRFIVKRILAGAIYAANPWIKWFDSTTHGYAILELSHRKATWSAYGVEDVRKKKSPRKKLLFQCEVPRDQVKLDVLKD
ncbi:alkaline phosphatase [Mechercharimyces sp. CAU 1602]|uniref:alkaline phosphatase D family protein n=1 Tax=Mechercharimyces sp. CAU 1602 TaxID=2973933 RepID=UPI002163518F|nr:alkaline phosphatase D family protein [Mechercharimyces sp. CAU 1602]MCS1352244.1 alkaline phosphatase D family protein [Mechercharimyces sp. CAU 1602]